MRSFARKALNIPDTKLDELLKAEGADISDTEAESIATELNDIYRTTVQSIRNNAVQEGKKDADNKFKAGQRKAAEDYESKLRSLFGVDPDAELAGDDLMEAVEAVAKKGGKAPDGDIANHPEFQKVKREHDATLKKLKAEHETALNQLQEGFTKQQVKQKAIEKGMAEWRARNPVLSEDPKRAAAQARLMEKELASYDYVQDGDKFIPQKDGKDATDDLGNVMTFESHVSGIGDLYFDFQKAEERDPGNPDPNKTADPKKKASTYKGKLPKTQKEYEDLQNDATLSIEDKMAVNDHWEQVTKDSAGK